MNLTMVDILIIGFGIASGNIAAEWVVNKLDIKRRGNKKLGDSTGGFTEGEMISMTKRYNPLIPKPKDPPAQKRGKIK